MSQILRDVNKEPRLETLKEVAEAFSITVDELLERKVPKPEYDLSDMDPELREIFEEFLQLLPEEQIKILKDKAFKYINPKIIKEAIDEIKADESDD